MKMDNREQLENVKTLHVRLATTTHRCLRVAAARRGISMQQLVSRMIREGLAARRKRSREAVQNIQIVD